MTNGKKKRAGFARKPLQLNPEEQIELADYLNADELTQRDAIWRYVEEDHPIPNALKPILLDILESGFKGKSKVINDRHSLLLVMEIEFLMKGIQIDETIRPALTQKEAIEVTAKTHEIEFDTLERKYKSGKFRKLKDQIRNNT